jgi:hypothetical protein
MTADIRKADSVSASSDALIDSIAALLKLAQFGLP